RVAAPPPHPLCLYPNLAANKTRVKIMGKTREF
ncbi:MAG: hypothetical protein ACI9OU_002815, partial [Candidatus Promineifilaceae bacterium]